MKGILILCVLFLSSILTAQITEPDTNTVFTDHFKLTDKAVKAGQCYQIYDVDFQTNTNQLNLPTPNGLDSVIDFLKRTKVEYIFVVVHQEKKLKGKVEENMGWERAKTIQRYMKKKGVKESTTIHIKAICTSLSYEDIKNKVKKSDTPRTINLLQKKPVTIYIMNP